MPVSSNPSSSSSSVRRTAAPPRRADGILAAPYRAITVGMLALISLLAFEYLAVATVMPVIAEALDGLSLYAAAFGAAMAASILGMVLAGRWSDRAGPAPALWTGCAGFVLGLLLVGAAPDMAWLVPGRALQGLGGGMVSVALYVVVGQVYPPALHARIFAAFAAAWVLPVIVGPAVAGGVAAHLGWRWVFLAAALLALPAAWLLHRGMAALAVAAGPASRAAGDAGPPGPRLWLAAATAGSAALLYAGTPSQGDGVSWSGAAMLLLALAGLALFAPRLLPPGTLRARTGLPAVVALRGLAAAAFFSGEVLIPLMLVQTRSLSPVQAGLVLTVGALGWSAGSWFQGREGQVHNRQRLLRIGMAAITAGLLVMAALLWPAVPVAAGALGWTLAGVGMGLVYPTLSMLTLACAAPSEQGAASSALQLSDALFSAVGLALASAGLGAASAGGPATQAYLAGLGAAASLALLGALLASRARVPSPAA